MTNSSQAHGRSASSNRSPAAAISDPASKQVEDFLVKHSQRAVARGGVRCLNSLVSSENLMCHHPCPVCFMPYSPSSSSHASSLSPQIINLYLLPKNAKTCRVVVMFHTSLLPPAHHVFVDLIFLLEFSICKRVKVCSHHSLMHSHQRVVRFYKGTVRRPSDATSHCATLCYAMLCTLNAVAVTSIHWEGEGLVC